LRQTILWLSEMHYHNVPQSTTRAPPLPNATHALIETRIKARALKQDEPPLIITEPTQVSSIARDCQHETG